MPSYSKLYYVIIPIIFNLKLVHSYMKEQSFGQICNKNRGSFFKRGPFKIPRKSVEQIFESSYYWYLQVVTEFGRSAKNILARLFCTVQNSVPN